MAAEKPSRPDRRRIRAERGRIRRVEEWQADSQQRSDQRKGFVELSAGGKESGRPQLVADQGQRDLSPGRRPSAPVKVHLSVQAERDHSRVFRTHGRTRRRAGYRRYPVRHIRAAGSSLAVACPAVCKPGLQCALRTTCVATMLQAGHAVNALPQAARAMVNCRIMPGEPVDDVKATLVRVLADDQIAVTQLGVPVLSAPSALHEEIMGAIEKLTTEFWPGIPVMPTMSAGATDGSYLRNAGIPTYGHSGLASDVDDVRVHGRDERVLVKSFFDGQEYLYRLVKMLSGGN